MIDTLKLKAMRGWVRAVLMMALAVPLLMNIGGCGEPDLPAGVVMTNNPEADAEHAFTQNEVHFLGLRGYAVVVPGISAAELAEYLNAPEVILLPSSDAGEGAKRFDRYEPYCERFNFTMKRLVDSRPEAWPKTHANQAKPQWTPPALGRGKLDR